MKDKPLVGVLGANSLVGDGLLPLLAIQGKHCAAFSRRSTQHTPRPNISWLAVGQPLDENIKIQFWISLIPIWVLPDYFDWLAACGAKHVVALSSTSRFTKVDSSDPLEQALARRFASGEEKLALWAQSQDIAWTVLRPTLIYGFGRDKNVTTIARLIRRFGVFPLFGNACGLRQPVHARDLAAASIEAFTNPEARGRAFNVSGGEILRYHDMVARIFTALGKPPRFIRIPLWVFRAVIFVMKALPPFRKWSPAMVERMNQDMIFDHEDAERYLNFSPRGFVLEKHDLL